MKKISLLFLFAALSSIIFAGNKTALVIGNGDYTHFSSLPKVAQEAKAMSSTLKRLGFEVILIQNGSREDMLIGLKKFEALLKKRGGLALVHYGGHGVQVNGKNYLIPSNVDIPDELRVETRAVNVDEIMLTLKVSGSSRNIVILDACRNNPLPAESRSSDRGLAVVSNQPSDSIIVYAADAGKKARDGLFTPTLLKYIEQPGLEFYDLLQKVRVEVRKASGGEQTPAAYNMLEGKIYLAGETSSPDTPTPGFDLEEIKYGRVRVSVKSSCDVYIDGKFLGKIPAGRTVSLSKVAAGQHKLEVRYLNYSEFKDIFVNPDQTYTTLFDYLAAPEGMVFVEGGTFQMGSNDGEGYEKPVHKVTVSSFYIGKYEVTQSEYEAVIGSNPSYSSYGIGDDYPVNIVSWYEMVEYCNKLSLREGLTPCYSINKSRKDVNNKNEYDDIKWTVTCNFNANGYRLPTEAEWEFAARGGRQSRGYKYSGSNTLSDVGWYVDNSGGKSHPVGQKAANELGIYDMSGNVLERCWDWYDNSYSSGSVSDPAGVSSGTSRVVRGGGWYNSGSDCRVAFRSNSSPSYRGYSMGFRLARRP